MVREDTKTLVEQTQELREELRQRAAQLHRYSDDLQETVRRLYDELPEPPEDGAHGQR